MVDSRYRLYTAEQVRGIDYAAIHDLGIAGYELMCRAGKAIFEETQRSFPSTRRWLVVCGPGNNGGDGYVVARLAAAAGIDVTLCSLVEPGQLKGDAALACRDWQAAGGVVEAWPLGGEARFDLALDALLGTGIDREVGGRFRDAIGYLNHLACPKLAIDIPSGLNADSGRVMGCAVRARCTVTFVGRKRGMYTLDGSDHCGHIVFDGLDIPPGAADSFAAKSGYLLNAEYLARVLPPRPRNSHKGSYGHVLAVGGLQGMSGAVRLCGEAALRSGAGLVTLATDPAHAVLVNSCRPELMVKPVGGGGELRAVLEDDFVLAAGPGLGQTEWSGQLLEVCLETDAPLVLDADGLNLLALRHEPFKRDNWILTPHPAEAARLLDCEVTDIQLDRVASAQALAGRYGACVVLKGCGTVVADPAGGYAICAHGNPGMATAGSGDVLTGIIAALLGQRLSCFDAAQAGVLAHALAGDDAAEKQSETSLIAGDIVAALPSVWAGAEAGAQRV